uniref:Uncharacterized protein n=1 Tax=Anguilla anguilla TaxID=7936 RepID=A0A0E9VSQ9_ANGAN
MSHLSFLIVEILESVILEKKEISAAKKPSIRLQATTLR